MIAEETRPRVNATKKTGLMEEHVRKQQCNDRDGQQARGIETILL